MYQWRNWHSEVWNVSIHFIQLELETGRPLTPRGAFILPHLICFQDSSQLADELDSSVNVLEK